MTRPEVPPPAGLRRGIGSAASGAARAADAATQILLVATVLVIFEGVVSRTFFGATPRWGEEIALRFIIWFSFLGASLATREGLHLGMSFVSDMLPPGAQAACRLFAHVAVIAFGVFMVVAGWRLVVSTAQQTLPATKLSVGYSSYLALPVSGALIALQEAATLLGVSSPGASAAA